MADGPDERRGKWPGAVRLAILLGGAALFWLLALMLARAVAG